MSNSAGAIASTYSRPALVRATLRVVRLKRRTPRRFSRLATALPIARCRLDAFEAEIGQIKRVDKTINHTNRITFLNPLNQAFRQQHRLSTIGTLDEALHELPPKLAKRIIADSSFSRSQAQTETSRRVRA